MFKVGEADEGASQSMSFSQTTTLPSTQTSSIVLQIRINRHTGRDGARKTGAAAVAEACLAHHSIEAADQHRWTRSTPLPSGLGDSADRNQGQRGAAAERSDPLAAHVRTIQLHLPFENNTTSPHAPARPRPQRMSERGRHLPFEAQAGSRPAKELAPRTATADCLSKWSPIRSS